MSSLREIKDRIGSVRGTLKITSAMKLVASAKLRKAQRTIESLRPYEQELDSILSSLMAGQSSVRTDLCAAHSDTQRTAVVVISSNSSLCGGFNANVLRKALEVIQETEGEVKVFAIGRKAADVMKKAGYVSDKDYSDIIGHPDYKKSSDLAGYLMNAFSAGEFSKVVLVYNHFVNGATQTPVAETYLPFSYEAGADARAFEEDMIVEPSEEEILRTLLPQVVTLKFHTAVLDSAAAEHAARTMAMQTATDNAEDLLSELTLEYNKGRQQKITAEILDLLGGAAEQ